MSGYQKGERETEVKGVKFEKLDNFYDVSEIKPNGRRKTNRPYRRVFAQNKLSDGKKVSQMG